MSSASPRPPMACLTTATFSARAGSVRDRSECSGNSVPGAWAEPRASGFSVAIVPGNEIVHAQLQGRGNIRVLPAKRTLDRPFTAAGRQRGADAPPPGGGHRARRGRGTGACVPVRDVWGGGPSRAVCTTWATSSRNGCLRANREDAPQRVAGQPAAERGEQQHACRRRREPCGADRAGGQDVPL